MFVDLIRL